MLILVAHAMSHTYDNGRKKARSASAFMRTAGGGRGQEETPASRRQQAGRGGRGVYGTSTYERYIQCTVYPRGLLASCFFVGRTNWTMPSNSSSS